MVSLVRTANSAEVTTLVLRDHVLVPARIASRQWLRLSTAGITSGNVIVAVNEHMLNPHQFDIVHDVTKGEYGMWNHELHAYHPEHTGGHEPVGGLLWSGNTGEIMGVHVVPKYQRQGIATKLYREATRYQPHPLHSPNHTDEGRAWSKAVGGPNYRPEFDE